MGKVSELSQLIEELNRCGNTLIGISEDLNNLFSSSEEVEESEPKTKVTEEAPAKAPKKEKPLSLEDVRAVMADKSRKGYTAEVKKDLWQRLKRMVGFVQSLYLLDIQECRTESFFFQKASLLLRNLRHRGRNRDLCRSQGTKF